MKSLVFVLLLAVVLIASGTAFAASLENIGGAVKLGVDFEGKVEVDVLGNSDTDTAASVCAEVYLIGNEYVDGGAGLQYLFKREVENSSGSKFWFLPVYAVVRVHPVMSDYTPYAIGQIGYAFHDGNDTYNAGYDTSGGLYWGAGAGFIFKRHFLTELLYSESNGSIDNTPGGTLDVKHRRVTFSVGYNF